MSNDKIISRSHNQARHLRQLNREQMFRRNRQSTYLDSYNLSTKNMIKQSLEGPIPNPLPPLSVTTISYYRRSNRPVFKTKLMEGQPFQPHMTYESLWLLAGIDQIENYPNFIQEFQQDLPSYLQSKFKEIREMAIIAAGNKIIGRPQDILKIVEDDEDQLWVLVNHIYDRKICFTNLYKFLNKGDAQIVYRTIFEMTNNHKDQIIQSIMANEQVLSLIIESLKHEKPEIQSFAVRILGNILAQKQQYAYDLMKFRILDHFYPLLNSKVRQVRKDAIWTISNYAFQKGPATDIICNSKFIERLMMMFRKKEKADLKKQLYYGFCHLVTNAEKQKIYELAIHENLLQQCLQDLRIEDIELNKLILLFITKIIDLGEYFVVPYQQDSQNYFGEYIRNSVDFKNIISQKSFSQNTQICDYSFQIMEKLHLNDEM